MDVFGLIALALLALLVAWGVVTYNALVNGRNQVANAWRQIDVQLKRRHDLIPNLVETVKGYMAHERETLAQVIEARAKAVGASTPKESIAAEGVLGAALGRLFALAENYPQLKADQHASRLMEELTTTENQISFARQFYNDSVMDQNNRIQSVPSNFVAGAFKFALETYFEAPEAEKAAPKVSFR
jgi:LemA protein